MNQISNHIFCDDFISNIKLEARLMPNQYNDYPYLIIKNFLSNSVCNDISQYTYRTSESHKAKVKTRLLNTIINPSVNENIRKTVIHKLPDMFLKAYELSFKAHQKEIEKFFSLALTKSTEVQALEYTKGSFYIKHADDSNELVNDRFETIGFVQVAPERKLTTVLFTTSHENNQTDFLSFNGGGLRFNYLYDTDGNQIDFFPKAGDMIVFPSNPIYSHEVLPVADGYRLTLVQWHNGIIS